MAKEKKTESPIEILFDALDISLGSSVDKTQFYLQPQIRSSEDVFRTNSVAWMIMNPTMNKKNWPQPSLLMLGAHNDNRSSMILDFYKQLRESMLSDYVSFLQKNCHMKTYKDVSNFKNMIDITGILDTPAKEKTAYPVIALKEEDFVRPRQLGWKCFLPCYQECVIRVSKWRYTYVRTENVRPDKRSFELYIEEYNGNNREWMLANTMRVQLNFGTPDNNELPMGWNILSLRTVEDIVMEFVPEMNWSTEKQTFWKDLFGFYDKDAMTIVRLYNPESEERKVSNEDFVDVTLTNEKAINELARSKFTKSGFMEIIARGKNAVGMNEDSMVEEKLKLFLNTICGIMTAVVDPEIKPVKEEDGNWIIDGIRFKSENDKQFQDWLFGDDIRGKFVTN